MHVNLDGQIAVVTGGSKGIGLAIATRMAASGAEVAIPARRHDVLEEARRAVVVSANGRVHAVVCDVSNAAELTRAYDEAIRVFGRVDILVNNAGTSRTGPFTSITDDVWQADLDLKLFAAMRLAACFGRR